MGSIFNLIMGWRTWQKETVRMNDFGGCFEFGIGAGFTVRIIW
jgi:hypothetical protein